MTLNDSKFNRNWSIKKLNDLGEFKRGKSKHRPRNDESLFIDGKYPLIQTGEIKEANLYIRKHTDMYNDFGLKQSKLWRENTLCITIAANIAETALLGYPMCFPDSVVGFNAYPKESSELFMHYVFTYVKKTIQNSASGSIQDNINIEYLTGLTLRIPDKTYQDKIAAVLSALDAKIELNQRINAELESMAKTLYDYWLVQFDFPNEKGKPYQSAGGKMVWNEALKREIPLGWDIQKLNSIFDFQKGIEPGSAEYKSEPINSDYIKFFRVGDVDGNTEIYVDATNRDFTIVAERDVVVTFDASVGKTAFGLNGAISGGFRKIYDRKGKFDNALVYFIFKDERILATIHKYATGSILLHASGSIKHLLIVFDEDIVIQFQVFVKPLFDKMVLNRIESQTLTKLRDWLLPMLMNGQVGVMG